jgi:type IV secretory pathway protease TraF
VIPTNALQLGASVGFLVIGVRLIQRSSGAEAVAVAGEAVAVAGEAVAVAGEAVAVAGEVAGERSKDPSAD